LISAAQDSLSFLRVGRVVTRRLGDACEERGLVGVIGGECGERPAEIVFGCRGKPVLTVSHVNEAGVAGENFFFSVAFRTETILHLFFDPQREPNLLQLANQHVDTTRADQT
jgi:hypothetical protein